MMKEMRLDKGLVGFQPDNEEDRVSAVSADRLINKGWRRQLIDLIRPYLEEEDGSKSGKH
jgi:hypothetical protein